MKSVVNPGSVAVFFVIAISGYAFPVFADGYIGVGVGEATINVCSDLQASGATTCDENDTGFKLFGGWRLNENLAIEGSYSDHGEVDASAPGFRVTAGATALAISVKGAWELANSFSVFGRLGYARWDTDVSITNLGSADDNGYDSTYGLGLEYSLTETLGVRGEWERTSFDSDDVDLLSINLVYRF